MLNLHSVGSVFRRPTHEEFSRWLFTLGLHRQELRAWAMYDWANSAFVTTIMAAVLPVYYYEVAAIDLSANLRTAYWGYTQTIALLAIAILSPFLGAVADCLGARKRFLMLFAGIGIFGSFLLSFVGEREWLFASAAFITGNIGYAVGEVFYASLLPHIARPHETNRVSTAGYAMGYVGGGLLLALQFGWITTPQIFGFEDASQASRIAFASVAVWWATFAIPIFWVIKEPNKQPPGSALSSRVLRTGIARVIETLRQIRRNRQVFLFLLAFWFYNDGISTIIKMATIYGAEIGIGRNHLIGALLLVQFLGIPCTFAFGTLSHWLGTKKSIYVTLWVYTAISVAGYFMTEPWHFWVLASSVGVVQGGSQALSRSLFAQLIPLEKSSEFFGFYSISGKFGNIAGPFVFALVSQLAGGSHLSILTLAVFFLIGIILLRQVDVQAGQLSSRTENANF